MDLLTYISDMSRRKALADACDTDPGYLWQIATRWRRKKPSAELAGRIEQETERLGPEKVPKEPLIFGPAQPSEGEVSDEAGAHLQSPPQHPNNKPLAIPTGGEDAHSMPDDLHDVRRCTSI